MNKVNLVNMTPHTIDLYQNGQRIESILSSGVIRLIEDIRVIGEINGIPLTIVERTVGELPPAQYNTMYIVSSMVLSAVRGRSDFVAPGKLVRNSEGQVIGCETFVVA